MATEAIIYQQIVDMNWDQAIYTASPNNTINVAQFAAKGSGTNIAVALTPKGTGYISAQVPNGTVAGGNARGENSLDLQMSRTAASEVASGLRSTIAGGAGNTASGRESFVAGSRSVASALCCIALGNIAQATGSNAVAIGANTIASGNQSYALGQTCTASGESTFATGNGAVAHFSAMRAHGAGNIAVGAAQEIAFALSGKTTTNSEVILFMRLNSIRAVLRSNSVMSGIVHIIGSKSDGSAVAIYHRQVSIKRVVNTTTLEKNEVVGVDTAAGTSINITADDTNDALSIGVTGIASETWRWVAVFHGAELAIGA